MFGHTKQFISGYICPVILKQIIYIKNKTLEMNVNEQINN